MCIQIAALKAVAARHGIPARARHYYKDVHAYLPTDAIYLLRDANAGEFVSLALLLPERRLGIQSYVQEVLGSDYDAGELIDEFSGFIDDCLDDLCSIAAIDQTAIGITTSKQQIVSSLVFAERLKSRNSDWRTIFGGAIMVEEVACGLIKRFPQIDHIIYGEGEEPLLRFLELGAAWNPSSWSEVPSHIYRGEFGIEVTDRCEKTSLHDLPIPDFDEYFDCSLKPNTTQLYPKITVETSRGCFYDICDFCNLNAQWSSRYRAKKSGQVHQEIQAQVDRYKSLRILFVDTNVANRRQLFDLMARDACDYECWGEVSGHVRRENFISLKDAGFRKIQIGVESFSTSMLDHLNKGVRAIRNMETLKWCAELGIDLYYNLIIEHPKETEDDWRETLRGMKAGFNFQYPALAPYVLAVDSPFDRKLSAEDRELLRAALPDHLKGMLPDVLQPILGPLLLTFVGTRPDYLYPERTARLRREISRWSARYDGNHGQPALTVRFGPKMAVLTYRVDGGEKHFVLSGSRARVYASCMDEAQDSRRIAESLGGDISETEVADVLLELEDLGFLYHADDRYLALACRHTGRDPVRPKIPRSIALPIV